MEKPLIKSATPTDSNIKEYTEKQVLKIKVWDQEERELIHDIFNDARQSKGVTEPTILARNDNELKIAIGEMVAERVFTNEIMPQIKRAIITGLDNPFGRLYCVSEDYRDEVDSHVRRKLREGHTNSYWEPLYDSVNNLPMDSALELMKETFDNEGRDDLLDRVREMSPYEAYDTLLGFVEDLTASNPD